MKLESRIKRYLEENGISQAFVCRKTGMDTVKLNLSLNGHRGLTFPEYELLCGALNLNTDHFLKPRKPEITELIEV